MSHVTSIAREPGSSLSREPTGPVGTVWPIRPAGSPQATGRWEPEREPEAAKTCATFEDAPYLLSQAPNNAETSALAGCDPEALYYGIGTAVDYARARQCAFTRDEPVQGGTMGGAEVLMMIYANGLGVPANFDLATRFACTMGSAPAEIDLRLSRLAEGRKSGKLASPMDVCDDITSGYMVGYCAAHQERLAAVPRQARQHAATAGMPVAELKALEAAAKSFFEIRSIWEVDLSGTARAMFSIEEKAKLEEDLVVTLEHLHDPYFTPPSADPKPLERELTILLRQIQASEEPSEATPGAVTPGGIRKAQRRWLPYRTQLLKLVHRVRPAAELDAWHALILRARLDQLHEYWPAG